MQPVSVIIPTYNRASLLTRAINSVLGQSSFGGEIIIVDDGSTDDTKDIVKGFHPKGCLKYIYMEKKGAAAARNRGVAEANHDIIAFLDSDDHWHKEKLSKQLKALCQNSSYSISHTGEKWLRRGLHLNQKEIHKPRHGYIFDHCLKLCAVGLSTVLMKKWLFLESGGFNESLPCCEDYDLWLRISSKYDFLLIPEPLTIKEGGREDQLSYQYRVGMDKYRIYALEQLLTKGDLNEQQITRTLAELKKKCKIYGRGCIKHGRHNEGERILNIPRKYLL